MPEITPPTTIYLHREEGDGPWVNAVWCEDRIDDTDIPFHAASTPALADEELDGLQKV